MYSFNIREEKFGATVYELDKGKRFYISLEELNQLYNEIKFPKELNYVVKDKNTLKITKKDNKENFNCFSFADIAYIELTRSCNLRCRHCLNSSGKAMKNQLNFGEFEDLILKFSESGIQEIRLTGGEPLVFPKIFDLIKLCTKLGIYTSIGTNGTLITKNVAKKLKDVGLKKAIVSIDGTEEKHDYIRGKGNYKKAMNGITNLLELNIDVRINSVIMKENMEDVIKLAKQIHELKQPLFIRRFIESGRGEKLLNNMLTKEDYDYVRNELKYELETANYVNGHYLKNNDETIYSRIEIPFKIKNGCKAGERALVITPEGNIHLCGFLAAQGFPPVGNVRDVENWDTYWLQIHSRNILENLEYSLSKYNEISGIQKTNCLAYVQRILTLEGKKRL